jgi:dipeptidase E
MGAIVAIGGGDVRTLATQPIDIEIIRLSGKSSPNALFIPTASSDSVEYWEGFDWAYRENYGCATDVLYLLGTAPPQEEIAEKIRWADIVYVGGGNTLKMMRRWRLLGVDNLLRAAFDRGAVLCGVSAGAICWFERGHSDSMSFYSSDDWSYIAVTGMGLLKGLACPHFNGDTAGVPRRQDFHRMMKRKRGNGLAIDNDCAVAFTADGYRVIPTVSGSGAYSLYVDRQDVIERRLSVTAEYQPLETLYER